MIELAELDSVVGPLEFGLSYASDSQATIRWSEVAISPQLPPGKSVLRCRAFILLVTGIDSLRLLRFRLQCNTLSSGSPCTGEGLEAQEWTTKTHILTAGTEDSLELNKRMPFLELGDFDEIVKYASDAMEIQLDFVPPNQTLSLHYIIAENSYPEPVECSAWFAVDVTHSKLPAP